LYGHIAAGRNQAEAHYLSNFAQEDRDAGSRPCRAVPGFTVPAKHFVNGRGIQPPFPAGLEKAMFGMDCFWGAERKF
jgi:hypothetical protein